MSFFRVSNPNASAFQIQDLGIEVAASASNVVLSNQFSVNDLYLSADLEAAIIGGSLTCQIDYGTGFASIAAIDYTNRDALASFMNIYEISNSNNNEQLVGEGDTALHKHDQMYFTETELSGPGGAALIGADDSAFSAVSGNTVQEMLASVDSQFSAQDLDSTYTNDVDGILKVDDSGKDLDFESDNINEVKITRKVGADKQSFLQTDVTGSEIELGHGLQGALPEINVRVKTNLIIDGNLTVTGTTTDNTVDELNITNANIRLRDGSAAIAAADAYVEVERGTTGADARMLWNESDDRWQAGTVGDMATIALKEKNEVITGEYEFQGPATTAPSLQFTNKTAAPSTDLGTSSQIGLAVINGTLAAHDKVRSKFLSVFRQLMMFSGRDSANNANEYARAGEFTSNQGGPRLMKNMTLVGASVGLKSAGTVSVRVRKNQTVTNLATITVTGAIGAQLTNLNIDFNAGDDIEVFLEGTSIDRPLIMLEFAERF